MIFPFFLMVSCIAVGFRLGHLRFQYPHLNPLQLNLQYRGIFSDF